MMKQLIPTPLMVVSLIKRFGSLLLPLPLCMILIGCDSQSSTTAAAHNASIKQSLTDSKVRHDNKHNSVQVDSDSESVAVADDVVSVDEGDSLLAAAKPDSPDTNVQSRRTPMISNASMDSELQATLIGDYVGILPCSFCSGITVTLNLFADGSITKTSIYENPTTPKVPLTEYGIYRQDNDTITIVYENDQIESYRIENNHLVMLNDDDTLNTDYTLSLK
ncbi:MULTISPECIES: copper resistance protein NlpE [unclassified Psychrobacter]|uniref:copper resistance protein NlpE n=1 Tax=unclassified Psychrobacter TaxID=196806 RepID=UPI003F45AABE